MRGKPKSTRSAPRVLYSPKEPPARSHIWTRFAKQVAASAMARTGQNESTITEFLMRKYGGQLSAEDFAGEQQPSA